MDKTYKIQGGHQPTLKRYADLNGPDYYPTPEWATHALIENEKFQGKIWEPACGDGCMADILKLTGCKIKSTDLYDRGYGKGGVNFLTSKLRSDNIVTNPPFHSAQSFAEQALKLANNKVALLLRLAFLEGVERANTLFNKNPPTTVWVFSERITFYPKGKEKKGSGTVAYAWFTWDKNSKNKKRTEVKWIPTGLKKKYAS